MPWEFKSPLAHFGDPERRSALGYGLRFLICGLSAFSSRIMASIIASCASHSVLVEENAPQDDRAGLLEVLDAASGSETTHGLPTPLGGASQAVALVVASTA